MTERVTDNDVYQEISLPVEWVQRDGFDTLVCTVPTRELDYDEDDCLVGTTRQCDAEVYTTWHFSVPVVRGDLQEAHDVPKAAVSSSWELTCAEGHVLATSANNRNTRDSAESFSPIFVLGIE